MLTTLETNLYMSVFEDLFVGLAETWKIRNRDEELLLYFFGENTVGKDCTEIYHKTEILQQYQDSKGPTRNTTKKG